VNVRDHDNPKNKNKNMKIHILKFQVVIINLSYLDYYKKKIQS
jgi:hypothetical protein